MISIASFHIFSKCSKHFSPLQNKFLLQWLPLAVSWTEERKRNTEHILSSKQMAGRKREVWPGRSKGLFFFFFLTGCTDSFGPLIPRPSPPAPSLSSAPLSPPPRLLPELLAEVSGVHRSGGPSEGKAQAAPKAFGFFRAGCDGSWSPVMPTPILSLDSVASTASADRSRSPVQGAAPHLPGSWDAKSLRQMVGRGAPGLSGSSPRSGRRRENQPGSVTETNWRREERVLSTALPVLNLGRGKTRCPAPPGDALSHPLCPAGPSSPAGPYRLDKGVWYRTWERVLRSPPGRPFRRDFGDFYSFRPNYFHLFQAKTIFLAFLKKLLLLSWFTYTRRLRIFLGDFVTIEIR